MKKRALVIGNWKMQPASRSLAVKLGKELKQKLRREHDTLIAIAPPSVYLDAVRTMLSGTKTIALAAQDAFYEKPGAYTGEIALPMLKDFGVSYIILGHSERRALGETNEQVNKKLTAAVKDGLTGVVCVGERERDSAGHYLSLIEEQVRQALKGIGKAKLAHVVIAYEPIWAIGTGLNATPADALEVKLFIERILADVYGRAYAARVRILYGGSVNAKNAKELYEGGAVDGFLVGGASLKAEDFAQVIRTTK